MRATGPWHAEASSAARLRRDRVVTGVLVVAALGLVPSGVGIEAVPFLGWWTG